jgi:hypothetical protein
MNPALKYQVIIHNNDWHLAQEWCQQNIGEFDQDWYKLGIDPMSSMFDQKIQSVWYFRDETDAVMFSLKWVK